jgi:hypothetical protein
MATIVQTALSPIEQAKLNASQSSNKDKKEVDNNANKKKKNDWEAFGLDVVKNIIYIVLWGLIGANFIYISRSNLDAWFPTNSNAPPYFDPSKQSSFGGIMGKTSERTQIKIDVDQSKMLYDTLGMNKVGFPYNKITDKSGFSNIIGHYFGQSARFSYTSGRGIIKSFLNFFKGGENKKEIALFLIGFPLFVLSCIFLLPLFIGGFTTFIGQFTTGKLGILFSILAMIFGVGFFWSIGVGVVQFLQFLITFTILPPLINLDKILTIISDRGELLLGIFTALIIYSAFKRLDNVIAIIMLVSAIFIVGGKKTHDIIRNKE